MPNKPIINLGIAPDTGTGDSARRGGEKINNLLVDTYTTLGDNALVLNNEDPHYGTRSSFIENSFMVGELHPAGRWQRVVAQDPTILRAVDSSNANIFYASRGEQITVDLSQLVPATNNLENSIANAANNRFQIILPLAREGDVVRIRDVNRTWGLLGTTRTQATGIDVWTTPFNYQGPETDWEWGTRVTGTEADRPAVAHTNINQSNRSRFAVDAVNGNTQVFKTPNGPLRITLTNADLEFVYAGHNYGWIVNTSNSFNPANQGNLALPFDSAGPEWIATNVIDSNGDILPGYSVIYREDLHAKGLRPVVQVEERIGNIYRATTDGVIVDVVAVDHPLLTRDDTGGATPIPVVNVGEGDIVVSVAGITNRFTGRVIASNGV